MEQRRLATAAAVVLVLVMISEVALSTRRLSASCGRGRSYLRGVHELETPRLCPEPRASTPGEAGSGPATAAAFVESGSSRRQIFQK
jgi:hypothetical protein